MGYLVRLETVSSELFVYFDMSQDAGVPRRYETGDVDLDWITQQHQKMNLVRNAPDGRFNLLMDVMRDQLDCYSTFI